MVTIKDRSTRKAPARSAPKRGIRQPSFAKGVLLRIKGDLERTPRPLLDAILKTLHANRDDLRNAVLTRVLSLTWQAMERVPSRTLVEAASASSDQQALLRILEAPEMALPDADVTSIEAARARGIEARDQLIKAEGGSWAVQRVAKYLGLTRQAVDKRRKANKLIGLGLGRHGSSIPLGSSVRPGPCPASKRPWQNCADRTNGHRSSSCSAPTIASTERHRSGPFAEGGLTM